MDIKLQAWTVETMKIAMIGHKCVPAASGGVERHVEELSRRLAERGPHGNRV